MSFVNFVLHSIALSIPKIQMELVLHEFQLFLWPEISLPFLSIPGYRRYSSGVLVPLLQKHSMCVFSSHFILFL